MSKLFKKTISMEGMSVNRIEMSVMPGELPGEDIYALMISIGNPETGASETIDISGTQFPAIINIIQNAFQTAEDKLVNWSQGEITEE